MAPMKTVEEIRHERLLWLRGRYSSVQAFADAIGKAPSQVSQLINQSKHSKTGRPRVMGSEIAREIEERLGLLSGVMDTALSVDPAQQRTSVQSHGMSLSSINLPPTIIEWGGLVTADITKPFTVRLADDAMKPDFPAGAIIQFEPVTKTPDIGDKVLVRDRRGLFYFRTYAQTPEDAWEAVPKDLNFMALRPTRDGAVVVAVKAGHFVAGSK